MRSTSIRSAISRHRPGSPSVAFARRASASCAARRSVHAAMALVNALFETSSCSSSGPITWRISKPRGVSSARVAKNRAACSTISAPPSSRKRSSPLQRTYVSTDQAMSATTWISRWPVSTSSRRPPGPVTNDGVTSSPDAADSHANHAPESPASSAWRIAAGSVCRRYSRSRRATSGSAAA